jgi:hypothetical protein
LRQAERPENYAFVSDGVLFIGINLVAGTIHDSQEWLQRGADNLAWIETNFALFGDDVSSAVISGHANPSRSGYGSFEDGLISAVQSFADPVLYLQGDTHQWDYGKPYSSAPNFTKVVVDQSDASSIPLLVEVNADPDNPFTFDHDFGLIA